MTNNICNTNLNNVLSFLFLLEQLQRFLLLKFHQLFLFLFEISSFFLFPLLVELNFKQILLLVLVCNLDIIAEFFQYAKTLKSPTNRRTASRRKVCMLGRGVIPSHKVLSASPSCSSILHLRPLPPNNISHQFLNEEFYNFY